MTAQPDAEATSSNPATAPDSEDSDEGTSQEELPITSWNQLSIIERVGLGSMELSEKDLETAFSHIALASRCDQYTLTQRLQAEEHARNLAEDNVRLELTRGRETLEMLKGLCLDTERSDILQRMERSLDVLGGTVERISNTAELLGAVHQEARVSRAVKLMVAHVENLKVQHHRNVAELEEVKKRVQQQNSSKTASDPRASPDPEESDGRKKNSHQNSGVRHRVSTTLIPSQLQERIKRDKKKPAPPGRDSSLPCPSPPRLTSESSRSAMSRDDRLPVDGRPLDPEETLSDAPAVELRPAPPPSRECLALRQLATRKLRNNNSPQETLRHRHKGKAALSKKRADKEKKSSNIYRRLSVSTGGSWWRPRPLAGWLCRRPLLCVCLLLLGGAALTCLLWKLQDEAPEP